MASFPSLANASRGPLLAHSRPGVAERALCFWHLLSLDAPTVAVLWAAAFAEAAGVHLRLWWVPAIALSVWAVYVGDRLLDARAGLSDASRHSLQARHHFHWRHRAWMQAAAVVAAVVAGWLVLTHIPVVMLRRDSPLAVATVAYFSGIHLRMRVPRWMTHLASREFLVGLLFTLGCALPVFSARIFVTQHASQIAALAAPIAYFCALAWLNVRSITWWEDSAPRGLQPRVQALSLALLGAPLALWLLIHHQRCAGLVLTGAAAALLLAALDTLRSRVDALTLRAAADLVLLTPMLLLPWFGFR